MDAWGQLAASQDADEVDSGEGDSHVTALVPLLGAGMDAEELGARSHGAASEGGEAVLEFFGSHGLLIPRGHCPWARSISWAGRRSMQLPHAFGARLHRSFSCSYRSPSPRLQFSSGAIPRTRWRTSM